MVSKPIAHLDTVEKLPRWDDHDPTDLDELVHWTARIIIFGGIEAAALTGIDLGARPAVPSGGHGQREQLELSDDAACQRLGPA